MLSLPKEYRLFLLLSLLSRLLLLFLSGYLFLLSLPSLLYGLLLLSRLWLRSLLLCLSSLWSLGLEDLCGGENETALERWVFLSLDLDLSA